MYAEIKPFHFRFKPAKNIFFCSRAEGSCSFYEYIKRLFFNNSKLWLKFQNVNNAFLKGDYGLAMLIGNCMFNLSAFWGDGIIWLWHAKAPAFPASSAHQPCCVVTLQPVIHTHNLPTAVRRLKQKPRHCGEMVLLTMIARLADGLPLAASMQEDEQVKKKKQNSCFSNGDLSYLIDITTSICTVLNVERHWLSATETIMKPFTPVPMNQRSSERASRPTLTISCQHRFAPILMLIQI